MTDEPTDGPHAEIEGLLQRLFGAADPSVPRAERRADARSPESTVSADAVAAELDDLLRLLAGDADGTAFEIVRGDVVFEADGDPALVGVRAAGLLEGQQLVVDAGDLTVVLDVIEVLGGAGGREAATGGDPGLDADGRGLRSVRGEVLGSDEVLSVQLLDGVVEVALAVTDELGEFRFDDVPAGTYELVVAGSHREVSATITVN